MKNFLLLLLPLVFLTGFHPKESTNDIMIGVWSTCDCQFPLSNITELTFERGVKTNCSSKGCPVTKWTFLNKDGLHVMRECFQTCPPYLISAGSNLGYQEVDYKDEVLRLQDYQGITQTFDIVFTENKFTLIKR